MLEIPGTCIRPVRKRLVNAWRNGLWEQRTARRSCTQDLFMIPCRSSETRSRYISCTLGRGLKRETECCVDFRLQGPIESSIGPTHESKGKISWFPVLRYCLR